MVRQALTMNEERAYGGTGDGPRISLKYTVDGRTIVQTASAGRFASTSRMTLSAPHIFSRDSASVDGGQLAHIWNLQQLKGARPQFYRGPDRSSIKIVDLFCGCGGLSLGVKRAVEAVGLRPIFLLAADVNKAALNVYLKNLRPLQAIQVNVENLIDYAHVGRGDKFSLNADALYMSEPLALITGDVDILLAGPPCEGNSNLNNLTRRFDRRNELYLDAVVAGVALNAAVIVIENVPTVQRSYQGVVERSLRLLEGGGYLVQYGEFLLSASDFGTPQERRRHFLIAGKQERTVTQGDFDALRISAPSASEALASLCDIERRTTFDQPSRLSHDNRRRVQFLVDQGEYDLPNDKRPDCHRLKDHSYPSVYGRMYPNRVAPTITTGFLSPGRGRFTHPHEARSLTPHEGARLQGFGEEFNWLPASGRITRSEYANMIGAAVPPQLSFAVGMCALSIL